MLGLLLINSLDKEWCCVGCWSYAAWREQHL